MTKTLHGQKKNAAIIIYLAFIEMQFLIKTPIFKRFISSLFVAALKCIKFHLHQQWRYDDSFVKKRDY